MHGPRFRTLVAKVAATGMVAAGALTAATAAPADARVAPPTTHVYIGSARAVHMPTHLHPGVLRFSVRSAKSSAFQLVRVHGDYGKAKLVHDVNNGVGANDSSTPSALRAIRRFEKHVTLLGGVPSAPRHRGVMWTALRPGSYMAVDTNLAPVTAAKILTLHVSGAPVAGAFPAGPRIRAVHEADWAPNPKSIPHEGNLRFVNRSKDNHFISGARIARGKTMKDVRRWFRRAANGQNPGQPPFDMSGPQLGTGVVSPGHRMAMHYQLPRGRYVIMCWWPDAEMHGMPHAFMGMYRKVVVR